MSVRIGTNIASLNAQRRLAENTQSLGKISERLASGQRINSASDDAAGLAISSTLKTNARVFSQAIRNINDGISLVNIAEGALTSLADITTRLKELATQSSNGVYSTQQRISIESEGEALVKEFNRITEVISYNGQNILNGRTSKIDLQLDTSIISLALGQGISRAEGTGTFGSSISFSSTGVTHSQSLVTGDFNGDGKLDFIEARNGATRLFAGNGDGTFSSPITVVGYAGGVTTGDLNGDGNLDLIFGNYGTAEARVAFGNGNGSFQATTQYTFTGSIASPANANEVHLIDVNNDGALDIVTSDIGNNSTNKVGVLLNNGNGTFYSGGIYESGPAGGTSGHHITTGDVNGDGKADIVSISSDNNEVGILLGNGDGSFSERITFAGGNWGHGAILNDLDHDGNLDLLFGGSSTGELRVLMGNGNGSFRAMVSYAGVNGTGYSTTGDINGDGYIDVIRINNATQAGVFIGNGDGTFKSVITASIDSRAGGVLADFNNDGAVELVTGTSTDTVSIYSQLTNRTSKIQFFNLSRKDTALAALGQLDQIFERVSKELSSLGASQSRLSIAQNVLSISRENYLAAASRIEDADVAQESANYTRTRILQQASASVLAQANIQPSLALKLLSD